MYNMEIESKHKAYHIFLQVIVILNTENFINVAMGYRNTKARDLQVKVLLTQLTPPSCIVVILQLMVCTHGS